MSLGHTPAAGAARQYGATVLISAAAAISASLSVARLIEPTLLAV